MRACWRTSPEAPVSTSPPFLRAEVLWSTNRTLAPPFAASYSSQTPSPYAQCRSHYHYSSNQLRHLWLRLLPSTRSDILWQSFWHLNSFSLRTKFTTFYHFRTCCHRSICRSHFNFKVLLLSVHLRGGFFVNESMCAVPMIFIRRHAALVTTDGLAVFFKTHAHLRVIDQHALIYNTIGGPLFFISVKLLLKHRSNGYEN